jgi:hypothetical protein
MQLPVDGDRPRERLWFITIDDLEMTYCLFDRHRREVQQKLDRASNLLVLLGDAPEELLDGSLLVVVVIAELHHLLLQSVKTESEIINTLTWLEGHVLPLLAGASAADMCRSDGVPSLLDSPLLSKRELHLGRDYSNEDIQRPSILVVINVAISNYLPHVPHLEPYSHHHGPLDVVGLGEGRSLAVGTDVPDNGLDPIVTMVPVQGGRAAPSVRSAISINPTVDAFTPIWVAAAVGDTAAARAPTRSVVGAFAPVRAAATAPLGVRGYPLCRLLPHCLPRQLELIVSVVIDRNRAVAATGAQSLQLCRRRTRCIRRRCCFYFYPCSASSAIASLAALAVVAAVSAAARSRSSVAATSASCQCCALKATER